MADFTDTLTDKHIAFIEKQPVYFTATAASEGRINLSPKGYADSFRVLSDRQVAYLDLGGSGNETHAHLAADGRIERNPPDLAPTWGVRHCAASPSRASLHASASCSRSSSRAMAA